MAPTPYLTAEAARLLEGEAWTKELLERAAALAGRECAPIDDHRASAAYRRDMVAALTRRAAEQLSSGLEVR